MAIKEEFEIRIDKNGQMKIVAKGFDGKECEIPIAKLQKLLDAQNGRVERSEEYYKVAKKVDAKVSDKK